MANFSITYSSEKLLPLIAKQAISFAKDHHCKIWLFEGEMGAGKTTLIKAVCKEMGVQNPVQSPTYGLVNEYTSPSLGKIYHFDFYRIKDETEALDIGYEDYFYSDNYCFVEWPSKIPSLLPAEYLKININLVSPNQRVIHLSKHE